jgi:predicted amidohydrolase
MANYSIGFCQYAPVRGDVAANIERIEALLAGARADLLVLPELANSGYMYASPAHLAPHSEPGDGSGPFLSAVRSLARRSGALIVAGFAEAAGSTLYNSAAAVSEDGVMAVYRKTHLFFNEKDLFSPGDTGFFVLAHKGVRIGMMICFDWYFPESARTLALRGAQILAHPSNLVLPNCQTAMVTRSLENRVFSITCNRYGVEDLDGQSLTFTGLSQALATRGERLIQAPVEGDSVSVAEIDPARADDKHATTRNHLLNERRPEMYA